MALVINNSTPHQKPMEGGEAQVRVRFVTKHERYRVTEAPFAVPARLTRFGLSEVVNHLLGNGAPAVAMHALGAALSTRRRTAGPLRLSGEQ